MLRKSCGYRYAEISKKGADYCALRNFHKTVYACMYSDISTLTVLMLYSLYGKPEQASKKVVDPL